MDIFMYKNEFTITKGDRRYSNITGGSSIY